MLVLVTAASRHGSTTEIAATIGSVLAAAGHDVRIVAAADVDDITGFEAAVIGSCVYLGAWLETAREAVERNRVTLGRIPVWLFSSGPVGDPPRLAEEPQDAVRLAALVDARDHRLFAGRVEKGRLGFAERAAVAAIRAPEGDFRRWDEIEAWARDIAATLEGAGARERTGTAG
jgi:menaquinone-dependent protoporphyrinogen oxidase